MKTTISETGISIIDKHHKRLFSIIDKLDELIDGNKCNKDLAQIFYKLTFYVEDYFTDEELLYKKYSYPKLSEIKQKHREFIADLSAVRRSFFDGKEHICITLKVFLQKWFQSHLIEYDKEAIEFLKEKIELVEA